MAFLPLIGLLCGEVLLVADVLHPGYRFAVGRLCNGDVGHSVGRSCAVPMLFIGREPDDVARTDFLDRAALALHPAEPEGDEQRLTERVRVPGSPCPRLERDDRTADTGGCGSAKGRVDPHRTGKPIRRSLPRWLRATSFDLHLFPPFDPS